MGFLSKLNAILWKAGSPGDYAGEMVEAIREGDSAQIRLLIREHPDLLSYTDGDGRSLLHLTQEPGIAETLVVNGAPTDKQDKDGLTPLHYAANTGNEALVHQLIIAGADVTLTAFDGTTAGDLAKRNGHDLVAAMLPQTLSEAFSEPKNPTRAGSN